MGNKSTNRKLKQMKYEEEKWLNREGGEN